MEWLEPVETTCNVKYSSSLVNTSVEDSLQLIHGSFPDANICWFANGDQLDVVSTKHGGVQSRHFQCHQGQEFEITCVAPIADEPLVLVGLSSNTGSGAVALYNYSTSLILNSWSISHKVTCICSMEMPNSNYKKILKSDCYLFAVGTEEGHVMLLAVDQHFKFSEGTHLLELNIVHYVTTDDILHKRAFFKPPVVLVIPLNDPMYRAGRFVLESMHESHEVLSKPQEEVCVTALRYIPQNQSLCVGYNTQGAFQLFSLKTLDLDFSGFAQGCNGEQLDQILDFAFLEPEDDPRHFCYLMVVAQTSPSSGRMTAPFALLYSLTYVNKDASSEGVIIYEDLQYITLRLDLNFGPLIIPTEADVAYGNATLLTCKSLPSSSNNNCTRATACYGLCYFAIQWSDGVYVGIFDLNQWYQAQMPARWIFDDMSHLCPFMGFYRSQVGSKKIVYQAWIQPDTMSIFHRSATTPAEAFFYPSALSFRLVMTSPSETQSFLFLGIQSLLLQNLAESGSLVLNQPHRFYIKAMKAGLAASEITAPNAIQMAESLLNIGLENNSRSFLISCIRDEGANLNFVEKWAWQQVVNLKALRENLCQMLFDHSAQEMEPQMHNQLYHVTHQFSNLSVLYDVMDKRIRSLNSGVNDKLRDKSRAISLLSLHLETVLWFLHGGLLPEVDDDQEESSSLPYPRRQLEEFYRTRRSDIEALNASVQAGEVLLIEQLVPSSVADLWAEERGSNDLIYPPPSLYALLSAYLRPDVDDVTKHRLVQYVFMDLTWIYGRHPHYGNILQHLMTFPSTYSLKPSTIKVTQAFWHLDHRNFDDALGMLLDPLVHAGDISNTQQRAILRSFLYQDQRRHALKYATLRHPVCPELEDIQLHLTILIANSLIGDALSYIRRNKNQRNSRELMDHLFCGCQEMRKFSVLLTLPLSDEEEEHVANYLKQSRNIDLQEALLLFYIQRCKYPDAIAYSQRLNQMWPARDAVSRERFNRREMLMQTLISALPPITCKLATVANSKPAANYGGVNYPRPLSVSVLPATTKVQYSGSNFFRTVIEQSRATWLIEQKLHEEAQTPLKSRKRKLDIPEEQPTMETENTPFLCNIVQPTKRNVTLGMSLVFPSPKVNAGHESSMMDITQFNETTKIDESQPKQGKRPRYSLFPKAVAGLKTDKDVVAVLQTPPIQRSRPMFQGSANADGSASNRPSSILKDKMRRFMDFSTFEPSPSSRPVSRNADGAETIISDSEAMEVSMVDSSTAKHLRFSLPNAKTSPSNSEGSPSRPENDVEAEMQQISSPKSPSGNVSVVAEEFLSFIEDSEPSNSVPQVSASPLTRSPLHPLPVNVIPPVEQSVVETADMSDDRMEITNMTTFHIPQEIQPSLPDDIFEEEPNEPEPTKVLDQGEPTDDKEDSGSEIICLDSNGTEEEVEEEESKHSSLDDQDTGSEGVNRKELESSLEEEGEEEEDSGKSNSPDEDVEAMYQPGSSVTVRKRFAPSSSSSSSYSNDGNSSNEGLDFSLRAKMEKSVVRGYSQVEPDLVSDHEAEETDQIAQPVEEVENPQEEEDEEAKEPNYSQVEDDLELNEEDEPESLDAVERVEVRGHLIAVTDSSPVDDFDLSNEEEEIEDEEEIQEDAEDEDFELKFSDTPCSTVNVATRRSSVRRSRFRMSIAASPGQEEEEVDENEEREVRGPELSQYDLGEGEEESSAEEEDEQPEVTRRVSSHPSSHKSKLQFSDSESSSAEEESDIEEVAQEPMADRSVAMESADVSVEEDNVQHSKSAPSKTRLEFTDSESSGTEEEQEEDEQPEEEDMGAQGDPLSTSSQEDDALEQQGSVSPTLARPSKEETSVLSEGSLTEDNQDFKDKSIHHEGESSDIEEVAQESEGDQSEAMESADDSVDESNVQPSKPASSKARLELTDSESSGAEDEEEEEDADEQPEEADEGTEEDPLSTSNQEDPLKKRESVSPSLVHPTKEETSVLSEGSLTEDNQDFKERLLRHEVVPIPLLPDASVIPAGGHNLSVIAEERTFEQSIAIERSEFSSVEEEEEEIEDEMKEDDIIPKVLLVNADAEEGEAEVTKDRQSSSDFLVDTMDAAIVDEEAFEVDEPGDKNDTTEVDEPAEKDEEPSEIEDHAEKDEEVEEMEPVGPRRRGRPRSVKLSRVPLPFSSRRTTWDPSIVSEFRQSRAPSSSPTKEIPSQIAGPSDVNQEEEKIKSSDKETEQEQIEEPVVPRKRGRPKSVKLSLPQQDATPEPSPTVEEAPKITTPRPRGRPRRMSNTSTEQAAPAASQSIALTRRSNRIAVSSGTEEDDPGTPTLQLTPPRAIPKRRSRAAVEEETSVPPSVEVSPAGSNVSGMGSAPGTPMRRSIRLALRDRTPEPTGSASIGEALLASLSRIRRHSASGPTPGDVTPRRRSGRISANASRDNSPNSITSEPPPRTETTPGRKTKPKARGLRSAVKSATLNLFPVEEEETEAKVEAKEQEQQQQTDMDESFSSQDEELAQDETKSKKGGRGSRPPSVTSSPSSTRYNLRRTRRASELDIISEEDGARQQQSAEASDASVASTLKRRRQDPTEESSDQPGPSGSQEEVGSQEEEEPTKRTVRNKRRKKVEEAGPSEELHFAPTARPPPKSLPKRDSAVNKSRSSRGRRSLLLPEK